MKHLNSKYSTIYYKRIFPSFMFIIIGMALYTFSFSNYPAEINFEELLKKTSTPLWFIQSLPLFFVILIPVFYIFILMPLMDEVIDQTSSLQLRRGKQYITLPLQDIDKISYQSMITPHIVTLTIRTETTFSRKIRFIPVSSRSLNPFKKNQAIENLIDRINKR